MKKILIVEDDISIAELQKDYLEINGFSAVICDNGLNALNLMKQENFDLILLDIMLPEIGGLEILRHIRNEIDIPILLVSAKKDESDKIRGLGLGADDYITKPFSPSELIARVQSHLAKYDRIKNKYNNHILASNINIRGLEIIKDERRVIVNGKEINMAQKEFELLYFLALNPNRVFSREELFSKVWDMESLGDSSTVTVHIRRIREKIELDLSNAQYIETVWGAGYRFRA